MSSIFVPQVSCRASLQSWGQLLRSKEPAPRSWFQTTQPQWVCGLQDCGVYGFVDFSDDGAWDTEVILCEMN